MNIFAVNVLCAANTFTLRSECESDIQSPISRLVLNFPFSAHSFPCCKSNQSLTFLYMSKQTSPKCRWSGGRTGSHVCSLSPKLLTQSAMCHLIPGCWIILSSKSPQIPRTVVPERPCLPRARRPQRPRNPSPFSPAPESHALIS